MAQALKEDPEFQRYFLEHQKRSKMIQARKAEQQQQQQQQQLQQQQALEPNGTNIMGGDGGGGGYGQEGWAAEPFKGAGPPNAVCGPPPHDNYFR